MIKKTVYLTACLLLILNCCAQKDTLALRKLSVWAGINYFSQAGATLKGDYLVGNKFSCGLVAAYYSSRNSGYTTSYPNYLKGGYTTETNSNNIEQDFLFGVTGTYYFAGNSDLKKWRLWLSAGPVLRFSKFSNHQASLNPDYSYDFAYEFRKVKPFFSTGIDRKLKMGRIFLEFSFLYSGKTITNPHFTNIQGNFQQNPNTVYANFGALMFGTIGYSLFF